jgi:chemotaxis protein CheX
MNAQIIAAFTGATRDVLAQEVGEPVTVKGPRLQGGPCRAGDVMVVVGLAGRIEGAVLLGLDAKLAKDYLSAIMGEPVEELDEMALSGIGELANMIAGAAMSKLAEAGYPTVIAPPTVYVDGGTISTLSVPRLVFQVTVPRGMIDLQLAARVHAQ